jgi:hypothetical protein
VHYDLASKAVNIYFTYKPTDFRECLRRVSPKLDGLGVDQSALKGSAKAVSCRSAHAAVLSSQSDCVN